MPVSVPQLELQQQVQTQTPASAVTSTSALPEESSAAVLVSLQAPARAQTDRGAADALVASEGDGLSATVLAAAAVTGSSKGAAAADQSARRAGSSTAELPADGQQLTQDAPQVQADLALLSDLYPERSLGLVLGSSSSANRDLDEAVNQMLNGLQDQESLQEQALAGSLAVSTSVSLGYMVWLARGGALLASLASSLPAWAMVDPLPVLSRYRSRPSGNQAEDADANAEAETDHSERLFARMRSGPAQAAGVTQPPVAHVANKTVSGEAPATHQTHAEDVR